MKTSQDRQSAAAGKRQRKEKVFRFITGLILCLAVVFAGSGAVIWARPAAAVTNTFETGVVHIQLQEYSLDTEGQESTWSDGQVILPGMNISKIPRISNLGCACYVRIRPEFSGTEELTDACLYGIGEDWIKAADGYYYCRSILAEGTSVDFFKGLSVPEDFSQEQEGQQIMLKLQVDAIQSRNVEPDFLAESPWGMVEILKAENVGDDEIRTLQQLTEKQFVVEYQGEATKVIINEENFFGNIPTLLPGDEFTDGAKLINSSDKTVRLYFRSVVEDTSDIMDKIRLVIETEVEEKLNVIYDGPIRAEELSEDTLLMSIPAYGKGKMVFTIYVPAELDNEYVLQDKAVQWIFSTEEIVLPNEAVNTGDNRKVGGYFMLAGLSLGFAVRMIQRKRRADGQRW